MEGKGIEEKQVYSVSEINAIIRANLEYTFFDISVRGEISNFLRYSSGHLYFDIKDEGGKLRCVMFRSYAAKLGFEPSDGEKVIVKGTISLYEKRGDLQLLVKELKKDGLGELQIKFEELKRKLEKEGLFDKKFKKSLPFLPKRIGIVTSPLGAAIMDILRIIKRRYKGLYILIYPAKVQGEGAAESIAEGIKELNRIGNLDAIIIGRGGGSIEDLWAFNEEIVARAIFESEIPIISAVGHEIDFTISDFVADLRASTPSAAAELVVQRKDLIEEKIDSSIKKMENIIKYKIETYKNTLNKLSTHRAFSSFRLNIQRKHFTIDENIKRLTSYILKKVKTEKESLWKLSSRMNNLHPLKRVAKRRGEIEILKSKLSSEITKKIENRGKIIFEYEKSIKKEILKKIEIYRLKLNSLSEKLNSLSHNKVLERGYSIVLKGRKVVKSIEDVEIGDEINILLYKGKLKSKIKDKEGENGRKD